MNKKVLWISLLLTLIFGIITLNFINKEDQNITKEKEEIVNNNSIAIMLETNYATGIYEQSASSRWPSSGYEYNESLSYCENGSAIIWNDETRSVNLSTGIADKCYLYFDARTTLADYVISLYDSENEGANGLYLHDGIGTYTNANQEAEDNNYRYSGANPNNYVCFGSTDEECPDDNLYRIIGVFNNQVKLIKNTNWSNQMWDSGGSNVWNDTTKPGIREILNTTFLNTLDSSWQEMISMHTWKVGGGTSANLSNATVNHVFSYELGDNSSNITDTMKIGLMYVTDYGYAAAPTNWSRTVYNYNNATSANWMYRNANQWTISQNTDNTNHAFYVGSAGRVNYVNAVTSNYTARPTFYLNSDVFYYSGDGTENNPIRLSEIIIRPTINSVVITNITKESITLSVDAIGSDGNVDSISEYYYSINDGNYVVDSSSHTFTGLSPEQTYQIKVYVADTFGEQSNVYNLSAQTASIYLADVCSNGNNLASCITNFYDIYGLEATNIYYHNSSLANGAEDNSYRYAGASDDVNNYICFGSDASTCPSDNLYRIIGVFGNQVKLIMADYPTISQTGTGGAYITSLSASDFDPYKGNRSTIYQYNYNRGAANNTWSESNLNITNLNTTFLNTFSDTWQEYIAEATWYVNGYSTYNTTAATWQNAESTGTTWAGKIGLMYVSDYGFAASDSAWTTNMSSYNRTSIINNNWMYMGVLEWTISRASSDSYHVYIVSRDGYIGNHEVNLDGCSIRPCFYLTPDVTYAGGTGTMSDPIRIN